MSPNTKKEKKNPDLKKYDPPMRTRIKKSDEKKGEKKNGKEKKMKDGELG